VPAVCGLVVRRVALAARIHTARPELGDISVPMF
jgi:hypothetical protein